LFEKFDINKASNNKGDLYGYGLYFSNNINYSKRFGKYLYKCKIEINKPLDLTNKNVEKDFKYILENININKKDFEYIDDCLIDKSYTTLLRKLYQNITVKDLIKLGYDGIIGYCEEGGKEYVLWYDKNIEIIDII